MGKIRLLLLDSAEIFREGLARLLQSEPNIYVASTCSTVMEAMKYAQLKRPDVILIDIELPEGNAIMAILHIHKVVPTARIIILTHSKKNRDLFFAIGAGATGYLLKDNSFENLVRAITLTTQGKLVIDQPMATLMIQAVQFFDENIHLAKLEAINLLTRQEEVVLSLMARNTTNNEIANTLFTTENTIKAHVQNIMRKLHARTRWEATICALEGGMLYSEDGTGSHQT